MRRVVIAAVLAGWTALAGAQPQPPMQPKQAAADAFAEGQKRYAAGNYLGAADKFETAYALDPDPVYLFNIAQAYRFGKACAKAASSYKKFLNEVPNAPNGDKARQYLVQSEECAKQEAAEKQPPPPPPRDPVVSPVTPPPPPQPPESHPGRTKRLAGLGIAGVGVVAIGVGAFFTYKAHDLVLQREDLCKKEIADHGTCDWGAENREMRENDLNSRGDAAATKARIAWGIGGVAAIAGVALYLMGRDAEDQHATISVVPTSEGAMALGSLSF